MFRFRCSDVSCSSALRLPCVAATVLLTLTVGSGHAFAAWPLESSAEVLLAYGAEYVRDGSPATHSGLDLAGESGDQVLCPEAGVVSFVGRVPGVGGTILAMTVRTSDDLLVTLMPLASAAVAEGEQVAASDVVGTLAGAGDGSCASTHVHVSLRRGERYLDPTALLGPAPVAITLPVEEVGGGIEPAVPVKDPPVPTTVEPPCTVAEAPASERVPVTASAANPAPVESIADAPLPAQSPPTGEFAHSALAVDASPSGGRAAQQMTGRDPAPRSITMRPQEFRTAHGGRPAMRERSSMNPDLLAGPALFAAGLLAMWPLWRRKGHPVPDVRPEFDDVAAAVSR